MNLLTNELALMLKKVAFDSQAIALAKRVFPLPGGPNRRMPFGGERSPVKISGRKLGKIRHSFNSCFMLSIPEMLSKVIFISLGIIVSLIVMTCGSYKFL